MRTFTSFYEMDNALVSRTYWKEDNKVFVTRISENQEIRKEEICTDCVVQQIQYSETETYFQVRTKRNTFHQAQSIEEINYVASLANLAIVFQLG